MERRREVRSTGPSCREGGPLVGRVSRCRVESMGRRMRKRETLTQDPGPHVQSYTLVYLTRDREHTAGKERGKMGAAAGEPAAQFGRARVGEGESGKSIMGEARRRSPVQGTRLHYHTRGTSYTWGRCRWLRLKLLGSCRQGSGPWVGWSLVNDGWDQLPWFNQYIRTSLFK